MLRQLGNIIAKRPWAIIAAWALILIASACIAPGIGGHMLYDTSSFMPAGAESQLAQDSYEAAFPDMPKSQLIVVVVSGNETDRRAFIEELNDTIPAKISNVTSTTSIYGVQRTLLEKVTPELHGRLLDGMEEARSASGDLYEAFDGVRDASNGLYWLKDNATTASDTLHKGVKSAQGASDQLYAARDRLVAANSGLYQLQDGASAATGTFYGVPAKFLQSYGSIRAAYPETDEATAGAWARDNTSDFISSLPADRRTMAANYLGVFYSGWTGNGGITDPQARASASIAGVTPSFIEGLRSGGIINESTQGIMLSALGYFSLSDYSDASKMRSFVIDTAMAKQGMTSDEDRQMVTAAYDLGRSPSKGAIDALVLEIASARMSGDQKDMAYRIFSLGRSPSEDTLAAAVIDAAAGKEGLNETQKQFLRDVWGLGYAMDGQFNDFVLKKASEGKSASDKENITEVFALGPGPDNQDIVDFLVDKAGREQGLNDSRKEDMRKILGLGRGPDNESLASFVSSKAADGLGICGNFSYLMALAGIGRNASDEELLAFADAWADTHGYDDPGLLPETTTEMLARNDTALYIVALSDDPASAGAKAAAANLTGLADGMAGKGMYEDVQAYVTGVPAFWQDTTTTAARDMASIDRISVPLILIILGVFFMSLAAPFVPLAALVVGLVTAIATLILVTGIAGDVYYMAQTFLLVTMMGAGIDYSVFMLSRYAEERKRGGDVKGSVKYAVLHAGKSVACSGLVAMVGFGSLTLIDHGIFRSIGLSAAIGLLVSMCVALTLVPAALVLAGDRVFWPGKPGGSGRLISGAGAAMRKLAGLSIRHPIVVVAAVLLVMAPAAYALSQMEMSQDFITMMPSTVESKQGFDVMKGEFGSSNVDRTSIVVTLPCNISENGSYSVDALERIERISAIAAGMPCVDKVYSLTRPYGDRIRYDSLSVYGELEKKRYEMYMDNNTGVDGRTTVVYVSYNGSPYSIEAFGSIAGMKAKLAEYTGSEGAGTQILIGGAAASVNDYIAACTPLYIPALIIVFTGIFLVLMLLLRSIVTPVRLLIDMMCVIGVTLAAFAFVFQDWLGLPIFWVLPMCLFCILTGLGGDYVVFMMSRVREEVDRGKDDEEAILDAIGAVGPVILLCGAVMAVAFGSMMASDMTQMKEFGFVLSIGILLDATFLIWMVVPASMMLFRKLSWWFPGRKKAAEAPAPVKKA